MDAAPLGHEEAEVHTRLMKCALEVEESRAWWHFADGGEATPLRAFQAYWFGARSLPRVEVIVTNMKARFNAFPQALEVLHRWPAMAPDVRRLICHWHLQLADPLYRAFTGDFLVARRERLRPEVERDVVVTWVGAFAGERWTIPSRIQFASKLLSAALSAGLVGTNRDPRPLLYPRVEEAAIEYLLYLLRGVRFTGTLLANPYLASVGLTGGALEDRLRSLPSVAYHRQGNLTDFTWKYADLRAWAAATQEGIR